MSCGVMRRVQGLRVGLVSSRRDLGVVVHLSAPYEVAECFQGAVTGAVGEEAAGAFKTAVLV